jgi:hypothetical protein
MDHRNMTCSRSMVNSWPWGGAATPGSGGHRDNSERERRSSGFSPMARLGGGAAKMATQRHSTEAASGGLMGRWILARGREIGPGVSVVDNEGALIAPFKGP